MSPFRPNRNATAGRSDTPPPPAPPASCGSGAARAREASITTSGYACFLLYCFRPSLRLPLQPLYPSHEPSAGQRGSRWTAYRFVP